MTEARRASSRARDPFPRWRGQRGAALIELALVVPLLAIMIMTTVDFGRLIQARLIITNVSREGGSIASRQTVVDTSLATVLKESGRPLDLVGADGKIIITRVKAGVSVNAPDPTILSQCSRGSLGRTSTIGTVGADPALPASIYHHLCFDPTQAGADISEVTVVEIYYKYRPVMRLPRDFGGSLFLSDGDGTIVWSRAIF
jgi:hypothetical protein